MRRLWREAPFLTAGLVVALLVAAFFAFRLVSGMMFWADPRHQDMTIAPWMSPRFVAMSWDVPREVVIEALQMTPDGQGPRPLARMAEERGVPVQALIDDLETAIADWRKTHPNE
ncbi:hypothetical protein KZZ07_19195 [Mameliella sp. CS4]|uniref:hypothetical protein n=1 Tax=Mameliella sp. CS4 TaxID=2862329 RepID=UPI001C5F770C|nr:hypothetical protein [Mameliella sp. CS4]MBW4984671.1 hypothetical protein [Mameliella sp. CS4]